MTVRHTHICKNVVKIPTGTRVCNALYTPAAQPKYKCPECGIAFKTIVRKGWRRP